MTQLAWVFMGAAWSIIIGCTLYCFIKLVTSDRGLGDD